MRTSRSSALLTLLGTLPLSVFALDPPRPVPNGATRPPVILINGYQLASIAQLGVCTAAVETPHSAGTFGDLEAALLASGAPIVYFFDNCVEAPKARIEELGNALGRTIDAIRNADGSPVQQVDIVAHSMGGLIARAYLQGLQANGTFTPPADPRVRKFVAISTPHFGSAFAAAIGSIPSVQPLLDDQVKAMFPASDFLYRLAQPTGWGDDLRGVDALSLVANAGRQPAVNASDGVVTLTSASLAFARGTERVRILPYCHTESDLIDCPSTGIAKARETARIVSSFLAGTDEWKSAAVSKVPEEDPYLSQSGGMFVSAENALGEPVTGLTRVAFGTSTLSINPALTAAWGEFLNGSSSVMLTAASGPTSGDTLHTGSFVFCGPFAPQIGTTILIRCRPGALIDAVEPSFAGPSGRVVLPGSRIAIRGSGFGATRCATCTVTAGGPIDIASWSDTEIIATLPSGRTGTLEVIVASSSFSNRFRIRVAPITIGIGSVVNGASFQHGFAPGGWLTITGVGLARTTRSWAASDFVGSALPSSLEGTSVRINGRPALVYYVSPTQLNVLAPAGDRDTDASRIVDIEVTSPSGTARTIARKLRYSPAPFLVNGFAAALHVDGTLVTTTGGRPAKPGDAIAVYVTGLGALPGYDPARIPPSFIPTTDPVTATLGGQSARVLFAGLVSPGLYQVNIVVPNLPSGSAQLVLEINGARSPTTIVPIL